MIMYDRILELLIESSAARKAQTARLLRKHSGVEPDQWFSQTGRAQQQAALRKLDTRRQQSGFKGHAAAQRVKPTKPNLPGQIGSGTHVRPENRGQEIGFMDDIRTRPRMSGARKPMPADTPDIENPDVDMPPPSQKDKDELEARTKAGAEGFRRSAERAEQGDAEGVADEVDKVDATAGKPKADREQTLRALRKVLGRDYNAEKFKGKAYGVGDMSPAEFVKYKEQHPMRPKKGTDAETLFDVEMQGIRKRKKAQKFLDKFRSFGGGLVAGVKAGDAAAKSQPRISSPKKFM